MSQKQLRPGKFVVQDQALASNTQTAHQTVPSLLQRQNQHWQEKNLPVFMEAKVNVLMASQLSS